MKILYFAICFFVSFLSFGQCPTNNITLSSQADVDAFATNYPGCTELDIDLSISGNDITDLSPLSNIESIHSLRIENNPQLQNLSGLNSITHIDGYNENNLNPLFIGNNAILTDISSLINMSNSNNMEGVVVRDNPLLQSLNGLQGFNNFIWLVDITNNDSLTDLVGLNNVVQTDDFVILNNENLINLNGLNSYSFGDIEIENNASLQNLVGLTSAFEGLIVLIENPSIQSLQGLEQASSIYGIYLDGNDALFDISAINAFTPENGIYFDFVIKNNSNLSVCNVEAVCSAFALCNENGEGCELVVIENNNADCESKAEVALNCGLVPSNDDCSTAIEVNLNETLQAYNDFATQSSQIPSCNDVDRLDVWFTFSSEIPLFVDIMIDDSYYMQVWEGTCENLVQVPNTCLQGSLDEFSIAADTDYFVQVWSDDSTSRMSSGLFDFLVQDATLSLDDDFKTSFIMFPNPVEDVLEFKSNKIVDSIEVYNVLGQNVLGSSPNGHNGQLDLSSLNSGVYFIKVEQLNVVNTFRIIKE
ncbi:T9SS type A sorting domain-containing protein [Psychroserpens sp. MEBiC05023]